MSHYLDASITELDEIISALESAMRPLLDRFNAQPAGAPRVEREIAMCAYAGFEDRIRRLREEQADMIAEVDAARCGSTIGRALCRINAD